MSDLLDDLGATDRKITRREQVAKERSAHKKTRRRARRPWRSVFILIFAVAFLSGTATFFIPEFFKGSAIVKDYPPGQTTGETTVEIPEGATGSEMAKILADADVVATPNAFVSAYEKEERASSIQPGTYRLKKKMSASAALSALIDPASKADNNITIPVGFTKAQVIARVANVLNVKREEVEAVASDANAIGLPAEANGNPEGWFYPDTYSFTPQTKPADVMKAMIDKRVKQLESLAVPREQWESVLIKASILDKEVGNAPKSMREEYMKKVARVIENRLVDTTEVGKKLQMDSTVLYGLGKTYGAPSSEEIHDPARDTPYNTYNHEGLPPSPIGAASEDAIKAVLSPAEGKWLYFVTVNTDTRETKFAENKAEHDAYVEEYKEWSSSKKSASASGTTG